MSLKFHRNVTLVKPAPQTLSDIGEMVPDGEPTRYPVWASWKEISGTERLAEEEFYGEDRIELVFWWNPVFETLSTKWDVIDERGNTLDIQSVTEMGGREVKIKLVATRREED